MTNLIDVPFACRFAASQVHSRAMSTPLTRQRAGSLFRDQPQADFRGATLRNFTFGDLVQHVRMRRCGLRVGLCGGCARSCLYAQCTTCCTTWLVAFALNLPASLVPPSSRSPPAARSFACRRQAPSMPTLALYTSFDRRTVRVCEFQNRTTHRTAALKRARVIILPHRLLHTECARRGVRPQSESRMIALPYSTQMGLS